MGKSSCAIAMSGIFLAAFIGCGSTQPETQGLTEVEGRVLSHSGTPIKGGTLVLRPQGGIRRAVTAEIGANGGFVIDGTKMNNGILPGDYEVYIIVGAGPQNQKLRRQVPLKYQRLSDDDSDLLVSLDESGDELLVKLKRG